jgi:hypothetical protein
MIIQALKGRHPDFALSGLVSVIASNHRALPNVIKLIYKFLIVIYYHYRNLPQNYQVKVIIF